MNDEPVPGHNRSCVVVNVYEGLYNDEIRDYSQILSLQDQGGNSITLILP